MKPRLEGYLAEVEEVLRTVYPGVINAGIVDDVDKAFTVGAMFRTNAVDLVVLHVTTYALSAIALPVVQQAKVPVIILDLSPGAAIDYTSFNAMKDRTRMTGEWLAFCSACPVPELANVFRRTGISFHQISGMLRNDPHVTRELTEWVEAARVAHLMRFNRMGCIGNYYSGMLDIYTDLTLHYARFGGHIEVMGIEVLSGLRREVTESEIAKRRTDFDATFDIQPGCAEEDLREAAITSVALDKLVDLYKLGSIAYYHRGDGNAENEATIHSIILGNSLLTARGIPVAGEYEVKNAQAMKIMDGFGAGGSFTEYYAMDHDADVVLMGHDGPGHIAIAQGRTKVRPLQVYHGKTGRGLSVEMSVQHGPVTLLSVVENREDGLLLLVAEGESVPGPILEIGNTNSRYRFPSGARRFVESWNSEGPAHHCAVGIGHIAPKIKKLGALLGMKVVQVGS